MILSIATAPEFATTFGGWEIVLILSAFLVLVGAIRLPGIIARNLSARGEAAPPRRSRGDELMLWVARGFDLGRIPIAPGTFGSLLGVLWFAALLVPGSLAFFLAGTIAGLGVSVWCCGEAERILGETDPGSVVLDEITALPICFLPWLTVERARFHAMPPVETFFSGRAWLSTLGVFVLFRVFDVLKPWPVRQSQSLPGGWGVTVDDVLAAVYVALASLFFLR